MISVGIIGGGGYTAGELLRILLYHPAAEVAYLHSNSQAAKPVASVHEDLVGDCFLTFTDEVDLSVDVLFLCMGHGQSKEFMASYELPDDLVVIDLSHDHRLHPDWVYGLPELNHTKIRQHERIANPGCFATAIQLALLPLARERLLRDEVHIHAITGSTGAGQMPSATTHFSWRNNNISAYKTFRHQHLPEIRQSLISLQPDFDQPLNFIPIRGDFPRGIFATLYTNIEGSLEEMQALYENYYLAEPFVVISTSNPNLKQVVNTNKCVLYLEKHDGKLLIISAIDNLTKGASGQAVQNMNLACGLEEDAGLNLKGTAF